MSNFRKTLGKIDSIVKSKGYVDYMTERNMGLSRSYLMRISDMDDVSEDEMVRVLDKVFKSYMNDEDNMYLVQDKNEFQEIMLKYEMAFVMLYSMNNDYEEIISKEYEKSKKAYDSNIELVTKMINDSESLYSNVSKRKKEIVLKTLLITRECINKAIEGKSNAIEPLDRIVKHGNKKAYNKAIFSVSKLEDFSYLDTIPNVQKARKMLAKKTFVDEQKVLDSIKLEMSPTKSMMIDVMVMTMYMSNEYNVFFKVNSMPMRVVNSIVRFVEAMVESTERINNSHINDGISLKDYSNNIYGIDTTNVYNMEDFICQITELNNDKIELDNEHIYKYLESVGINRMDLLDVTEDNEKKELVKSVNDIIAVYKEQSIIKAISNGDISSINQEVDSEELELITALSVAITSLKKLYKSESDKNFVSDVYVNKLENELETLKIENKSLIDSVKQSKKESDNRVKMLRKDIDMEILEKNKIINKIKDENEQIKEKYDKMKRDYELLLESTKNKEIEESFDFDKALAEINKHDVIMVGGYEKWVKKIKEYIPNIKHLAENRLGVSYTALSNDNAIVVYHAGYNNHGSFDKFKNNISKNATLVYMNSGANIELFVENVYNELVKWR